MTLLLSISIAKLLAKTSVLAKLPDSFARSQGELSSRNRDESVLEFYDKHASNNFWALGFDQSPMLRLKFKNDGDDDSHDLNVSFAFCNPLLLPIVPLFPLFVFINKLEDKLYLENLSRDHTQVIGTDWIMNDSRTWTMFSLYRLYIYFIYFNSQLKN